MSAARKLAILDTALLDRVLRCEALSIAARTFNGEAFDLESLHALADQHYAYIMGNDAALRPSLMIGKAK